MKEQRISGIGQEVKVEVRDSRGRVKHSHIERREIAQFLKRVRVLGPDGEVKEDTGLQPAHSFTLNFLKILEVHLRTYKVGSDLFIPTVQCLDTGSSLRTIYPEAIARAPSLYRNFFLAALDNDDLYGIVVGSGTTAEGNTDHKLTTKIAHGSGAGQLDYGPQSFVEPYVNGAYCDLVLSRSYYNATANPITAYEFGVYARKNGYYFCIIRDLEAGGKTVLSGDTMVVQYTIRVGSGFTRTFLYALLSFFLALQYNRLNVAGQVSSMIGDTDGATMIGWADGYLGANDPNNSDQFGLVIGSGTAAENFENSQLQTKIPNTLITYLNQNWATTQVVGANVDLVVSRSFYNDKAAQVLVNEVTLQAHNGANRGAPGIAILRDKLSGTVQIDVGDTGTIQYTLRTNVAD